MPNGRLSHGAGTPSAPSNENHVRVCKFRATAMPQSVTAKLRTDYVLRRGAVEQPHQAAVGRVDQLRRQLVGLVRALENRLERGRLVFTADDEHHTRRVIQYRWGERDSVGEQLADPVGNDQAAILCERARAWKERGGVPFRTESKQDQVEPRHLAFG